MTGNSNLSEEIEFLKSIDMFRDTQDRNDKDRHKLIGNRIKALSLAEEENKRTLNAQEGMIENLLRERERLNKILSDLQEKIDKWAKDTNFDVDGYFNLGDTLAYARLKEEISKIFKEMGQ